MEPRILLNKCLLIIREQPYRLCEIELYYYNDGHPDPYVHQNEVQSIFGRLYFHKFRNGNWKGIDLTFGDKDTKYSFLIRTLQIPSGDFITGACNVVNHLLKVWGYSSIPDFIEKEGEISILQQNSVIYIVNVPELPDLPIFTGPRVGLSSKYPQYRTLPYRYVSMIGKKAIKKQRSALHQLQ